MDFHALRKTFIANLSRAGDSSKTAQLLARHWDINLTMSTYTMLGVLDQAAVVEALTPPSRRTIRNILREQGLEPAPKRGDSTWDEFLRLHAATLCQADMLSVLSLTTCGIRDLFLIVFLHVETRRVFLTPSTTNPNEAWMVEQGGASPRFHPPTD